MHLTPEEVHNPQKTVDVYDLVNFTGSQTEARDWCLTSRLKKSETAPHPPSPRHITNIGYTEY